jgi:hypothetical protein
MPIQAENIVSVTSENLAEFAAEKLGLNKPDGATNEPEAAKDGVQATEEPKGDKAGEDAPKKKGNPKIESRFSELTEKRRAAEERAERAERELAEMKAKSEPKEPAEKVDNDIGPRPKKTEYTNDDDYEEAFAEWTKNKTLKEFREEQEQAKAEAKKEKVIKEWTKRLEKAKADLPDFEDMMQSSKAAVSDPARDAIIESEFGPQIAYALASDDELAEKVTGMKPADQLKWIGRQEDKFERLAEQESAKNEPKDEKPEPVKVERKAPPAPISPVKGGKTPDNPVNTPGEFKGSYQEWKAARMAQLQR